MWNAPTHEQLSQIPRLYETEHIPLAEKIIHLHLFVGSCDWFITEADETGELMFGYVVLNGDFQNAEWGYVSLSELKAIKVHGSIEIDNNIYWKKCQASEVQTICRGMNWQLKQPNKLMANMTA